MNKYYLYHKLSDWINNNSFRGRNTVRKAIRVFSPKMKDGIVVKTKYNFKLKIYPLFDKGIERKVFENGIYEEGTLWCFQKIIKRGDIILDVGANIGLTSIYAGILTGETGKVFSFEPLPTTFNILLENIHLNKLKNIIALNLALENRTGEAFIYENLHINRGAASLYKNQTNKGIPVKVDTLNNFIKSQSIANIDFIKIDIEGSELDMLKGGADFFRKSKKPIICIEYSSEVKSKYDPLLIYKILKFDFGYNLFKQQWGKESKSPLVPIKSEFDLPYHNNIYCFQENHYKYLPKDLFNKYES